MASLQDQLLKAGIVDKKKAKQVKHEKHKQLKQQPKGRVAEDEAKVLARKALEEKAARDREINRQRQEQAQQKAIAAQIIQLVELNRIDRQQGDQAYQFTDERKIKKLFVTARQQQQLIDGVVAIVRHGDGYELVPAGVADKISQRDEAAVVLHNMRSKAGESEDDPYAEFQIPDDLMW
ncbi:MAG: DUF2058 domain-containing protein [Porticoccaceae bacterium]|nr:DUF2058 domain-containing protein [Porticoccaceae bacterium]